MSANLNTFIEINKKTPVKKITGVFNKYISTKIIFLLLLLHV